MALEPWHVFFYTIPLDQHDKRFQAREADSFGGAHLAPTHGAEAFVCVGQAENSES
jgi:hypothetical protein